MTTPADSGRPGGEGRPPLTVAVLSPVLGGFYFGALLSGITREVAAAGGHVVLVQTLDPGISGDELVGPPSFDTRTAWDHIDGAVSLVVSAPRSYLERLRAAGKPVVTAGNEVAGFAARSVVPDNSSGIRAAVDHLLGVHGHTRVGFLGNLEQSDMQGRFHAYSEAMRTHGIEPDPALFYAATDNHELGGQEAARRLIADGMPATALVVATDRNALGLVAALRESGRSVPGDLAVVGFDDIEPWSSFVPTLTTVDPQFIEVGALAARVLLAEIRGEDIADGQHVVASRFVPRTSCGCSTATLRTAPAPNAAACTTHERRRDHRLLELAPDTQASRANELLTRTAALESSIAEQYAVSMSLLDPNGAAARSLLWMSATHVRLGCLALWDGGPGSGQLKVAGVYDPDGALMGPEPLLGTRIATTRFPPEAMLHHADPQSAEVTFVLPVKARGADWGLLAVVGRIDSTSIYSRAAYNHWAALLTVAFEQEHLQEVLRASEERYAVAARATNDGLWDWDLRTGATYYSDRCREMLGGDPAAAGAAVLFDAAHPDDLLALRSALALHVPGPIRSREVEHRIRQHDGSYRWVLCRALPVCVDGQPPHRIVGSLSDIHDRKVLEEQLRHQALYDTVTGLPNRRLFLDRLTSDLRTTTDLCVLFLDLDGFKNVNDTMGHEAGDQLLVAVAERLVHATRESDVAARYGGDEFAVLLHTTELPHICRVVERIQQAIAVPVQLQGRAISVTASVGVARYGSGGATAEDLLRNADLAMYGAKSTRQGSWAVHGGDDPQAAA